MMNIDRAKRAHPESQAKKVERRKESGEVKEAGHSGLP